MAVAGFSLGIVVATLPGVVLRLLAATEDYSEPPEQYRADTLTAQVDVGDCVSGATLLAGSVQDCGEPHFLEVYEREPLTEAVREYPPGDYLKYRASDICLASLPRYVGSASRADSYGFRAYVPTASAWEAGERDVVCALFPFGEEWVEGSAVHQ